MGNETKARRTSARHVWLHINWRSCTIVVVALSLLLVIATMGSNTWTADSYSTSHYSKRLKTTVIDLTMKAGLSIDEVLVVGREKTKNSDLATAIGIIRGDPILTYDLSAARQRILRLGWVADAEIERRIPDTIYIRLIERKPIAIWQRNKKFVLIDAKGAVIGDSETEHHQNLTLIVGIGAPLHASKLIDMLRTHPTLMDRVSEAIRVADRRWNLRFDNNVYVRLPEANPQVAWSRLAELQTGYELLERDIVAIDLRIPERLILRMRPGTARQIHTPGEHT